MAGTFLVGVTRDLLRPEGDRGYGDIGLDLLEGVPGLAWEFLEEHGAALRPEQMRGCDALLVLAPQIAAASLEGADRLALVARFGVGYDSVDVDACTRQGVLLTITPDGVRRPVAVAALTLILALAHQLLVKDRLTRAGRWDEKMQHMGVGLEGRTLGLLGLGNIGRELCALVAPLGMRVLAFDPYASAEVAQAAGAELVSLEVLLRAADVVCVCCALTPETHHLLDARRLALLRPSAYLVNVARGPIVDEPALIDALQAGRLAGAGLDVFETEPVDRQNPLLALDNVILAPHAIAWTDELFRGNGRSACRSILAVAAGRVPEYVVNRAVLAQPRLHARLLAYAARGAETGATT